jgi:hypothetical protein
MTTLRKTSAFAAVPITLAAALGMLDTQLSPWDTETPHHPAQIQTDIWPDEGTGYPGYAIQPPQLVPADWPDESGGYPIYPDPVPPTTTKSHQTLDTTSVALGALAGIALGGAALTLTLAVQRRRDTTESPA